MFVKLLRVCATFIMVSEQLTLLFNEKRAELRMLLCTDGQALNYYLDATSLSLLMSDLKAAIEYLKEQFKLFAAIEAELSSSSSSSADKVTDAGGSGIAYLRALFDALIILFNSTKKLT